MTNTDNQSNIMLGFFVLEFYPV